MCACIYMYIQVGLEYMCMYLYVHTGRTYVHEHVFICICTYRSDLWGQTLCSSCFQQYRGKGTLLRARDSMGN